MVLSTYHHPAREWVRDSALLIPKIHPGADVIECINSLKIHQERQQEERQAAGTGWSATRLVFATPNGRPLDPTNLIRRFRHLLHKAGLRTIRFHDLRHSTATLLLEQSVDSW